MEKIKEVFTGKSAEERDAERATRRGTGSNYTGATGAGTEYTAATGTEYTGGVAGGPAYGSTATGYTEGPEVAAVQQTTTTVPVVAAVPSGEAPRGQVGETYRQGEEATCAQEYFTKTEDRPVVKERVEMIKEHRPVEKEFVVETRATGVEREVAGGEVEHLGTTERVVAVTPPRPPCE